jgi:hypothetical protein
MSGRGCTGGGRVDRGPCPEDPVDLADPNWPRCERHAFLYRCWLCRWLEVPSWEWRFSDVTVCPTCRCEVYRPEDDPDEWQCPTCGEYPVAPMGVCFDHETPAPCDTAGCGREARPGRVFAPWEPLRAPDGSLVGLRSGEGPPSRLCAPCGAIRKAAEDRLQKEYRASLKAREGWTPEQHAALRDMGRAEPEEPEGQLSIL